MQEDKRGKILKDGKMELTYKISHKLLIPKIKTVMRWFAFFCPLVALFIVLLNALPVPVENKGIYDMLSLLCYVASMSFVWQYWDDESRIMQLEKSVQDMVIFNRDGYGRR